MTRLRGPPRPTRLGWGEAGCSELPCAPCQITVGTLATNATAPLPGSYSRSVSPFGGEDKGGNDQKLKLANGKQLRPGI